MRGLLIIEYTKWIFRLNLMHVCARFFFDIFQAGAHLFAHLYARTSARARFRALLSCCQHALFFIRSFLFFSDLWHFFAVAQPILKLDLC